ncbi:hypothetical protein ElyMa_001495900 [Elysia marginata]|uniref:Uncharacterized protein n=1 Tax=Elysia marginata TaxID=1093978 RepID=A0AAV4J9U7_9GAST|nr:hypothetical protein ElyMa_001495900 [Elysia marginata]
MLRRSDEYFYHSVGRKIKPWLWPPSGVNKHSKMASNPFLGSRKNSRSDVEEYSLSARMDNCTWHARAAEIRLRRKEEWMRQARIRQSIDQSYTGQQND